MEPDIREFFQRISLSIGIGVLWMVLNTTFGIMLDYAFIHGHVTAGNIIFYVWLAGSLVGAILLIKRLWRHPIKF